MLDVVVVDDAMVVVVVVRARLAGTITVELEVSEIVTDPPITEIIDREVVLVVSVVVLVLENEAVEEDVIVLMSVTVWPDISI